MQKYQNFSYNVDHRFSPYKPLYIQIVVTQHHHKLQGEGHFSVTKLGGYVIVDVSGKYVTFHALNVRIKIKK